MRTLRLLTWSKLHRLQVADLEFDIVVWLLSQTSAFDTAVHGLSSISNREYSQEKWAIVTPERSRKQKCWPVSAENCLPSPRSFPVPEVRASGYRTASFHMCFQMEIVAHIVTCFINVSLERAPRYPGGLRVLFKDLIILIFFLSTLW